MKHEIIEQLQVKIHQLVKEAEEGKLIYEKLLQSEARFKDIVNNALEWIWEVDMSGKYTYSSPVVKDILGYEPEEVIGKFFYDFFTPDQKSVLMKSAFKHFSCRKPFRKFINKNVSKNGKTVILSTSGVPVVNKEGKIVGYRGADTDITDQHLKQNAHEKLKSQQKELERVNAALNVLMEKRSQDKLLLQEKITANIKQLILPYVSRLRSTHSKSERLELIDLINNHLKEITEDFSYKLSSKHIGLTRTELKVADLVREGRKTKQIAHILCLSPKTIESHRQNIRKKLGIKNKKINLQAYLLAIH